VRRASAGLLLNRTIDAASALAWGLVTDVVPADALVPAAEAAARRIAASPVATMRNAKRLVWGDIAAIEAALEQERLRFIEAIVGSDARQGVERFLQTFTSYPDDED